ncbi:MAG: hypothetical protein JNJ61_10220 [Anaerolineae bacterium]|nr:hypothetical protein [Anaerolineae bacterium]
MNEPSNSIELLPMLPLIVFCGLRVAGIIVGIGVAWVVRKMLPFVNAITAAIFAGYAVGFVVLFAALLRLFPEMLWYDAATISLVVTAGIVFLISLLIKRTLYSQKDTLARDQGFAVFGEDRKARPKDLHKRKR